MSNSRYSKEFKQSAVEKLLGRGTRPIRLIGEELGVSKATLYQWQLEFAKVGAMKKPTRPEDRSPEEKLKIMNEYEAAPVETRGEVLRRLGVYKEHVESWKSQVHKALKYGAIGKHVERSERAEDRRQIRELEKDLLRKNSALAETTALLILKKKADLIWGTKEIE
jgi:transposase